MPQPQVTVFVTYPGPNGQQPSYFDITVNGNSYLANLGIIDAWCLDTDININNNTTYNATVYSSYEPNTLPAAFPTIENLNNFDLINWIINQNFTANPQYNYGEIQAAIWTLLGDTYDANASPLTANGPVLASDVAAIIALAQANGENFVPDTNEFIGVMLDVVNTNSTVRRQPIIAQIKAAKLGDFVWEDLDADGIQDAGENGINGVTVNLGRDFNSDGDINDLNEILATTTTDATGFYQFKGLTPSLEYQVQFITPAGFAAVSPRQQGGDPAKDSDGLLSDVVILSPGEYNQTIDAGFYKLASLGDFVWEDTNANGVQDAGENGINNVTVKLLDSNGNVIDTTTTNANGLYNFSGLTPGDYSVMFVAPAGYMFSPANQGGDDTKDSDANVGNGMTQQVTLTSGEFNGTLDAGLFQKASLGDFVWEDKNANGIQEAGENGINNVTVKLLDSNGNVIDTTTTDANGGYNFSNLAPGDYSVMFVAPAGYMFSPANQGGDDTKDSDANVGNGMTQQVTLTSGEFNGTLDAGLFQKASLGDFVWEDKNANGIQDAGENGINNVTVKLLDANGNQIGSTTTDANGGYNFSDLTPGSYSVMFVAPAGYMFSPANQGGDDTKDSDANVGNGMTQQVTLTSGEFNGTLDAGLFQKASLGDFVWEDKNANGVQEAGENGINNVTVKLLDANGNQIGSTTTDANGGYNFSGLTPGSYSVMFVAPAGYMFSPANQGGDDTKDSDANVGNGMTQQVTLTSGEFNGTLDAGLFQKASLGDFVWEDKNANGVQDAGENGINNVTVKLLDSNGNVIDTTTTDANGGYNFSNLAPGTYSVMFVAPAGYMFSPANQGGDDTKDSDANVGNGMTQQVTLTSGEFNGTLDAGLFQKASLGDFVWEDKNANGVQEAGENGINNVTVKLLDANGNQIGSTTTDANGGYNFSNLAPGDYSVMFVAPAGYMFSPANQGGDETKDSDANVGNGMTQQVTLTSGEFNGTLDAGLFQKASIGDRVWLDLDKDGIQDAGENGVSGIGVKLVNSAGTVIATTTTNASGNYLFGNLTPGSYRVDFDVTSLPAGYMVTTQDAAGSTDANDSDANPTTGQTIYTTLDSGETDLTWDMGIKANVAIDIEKYVRGKYMTETGGGEGLTPGFWKNHSVYGPAPLSGWPETGYSPDNSFETIFGIDVSGSNPTLLQALGTGGGGANALLRHATAALLNAANPYVDYLYTQSQIISMTQNAFATGNYDATKNLFEAQNELGADLSTPASGGTMVETLNEDADNPPGPVIPVGGQAIFTYVVTNPGTVALSNVQVTDDRISTLTFVGGDTDNDNKLDPGETWTYTAQETVQPGSFTNIGTVVGTDTVSTTTVTDSDAANYTTSPLKASIGDRVWEDTNANGVQDAGELGIAGVTVQLKNSSGTVIQTTTTDANGNYLFDVNPGTYSVGIVNPAGYMVTGKDLGGNDTKDSDIDPTTLMTANVAIAAGQQNLTLDAGLFRKASIGDFVWDDCDGDGVQDANEAGVAGVTVKLLNAAGAVASTTTTNANGKYLFSNLTPGTYSVQFVAPIGATFTLKDQGGNDALDSDADPTTGKTIQTVLDSGENDLSWDAGLKFTKICTDFIFNGSTATSGTLGNIRNYTSSGISVNASAFSRDKSTGAWATAYLGSYGGGLGVTDSSEGSGGSNTHTVDNVGRDNYILFEFNTNVILDKTFLGYVVNDSDVQVWIGNFNNPYSNHLTLSNSVLSSMGFTEVNTTTLTTTRWADLNAGEFIGNTIVIAADTTDITPEDYFKLQKLSVCTPGCPEPKASLGDFVWNDLNKNGIQDTGESGISGVTVKLLNASGTQIATTTTNAAGAYSFTDLNPGTYSVNFVAPTGYSFSPANQGSNDTKDSDAVNGTTQQVTLTAGQVNNTLDAGLYKPCVPVTLTFSGSSSLDGTDGNIRTFTKDGVSVKASAFSRDKSNGNWTKAYLGLYGEGLGVTDSSEGDGSSSKHRVDNIGRDNYVLFEFSVPVAIDSAYLNSVVNDSDISTWIGTFNNPFTNHLNLSDSLLNGMSSEVNTTESTSARWADINASELVGNTLVIAGWTGDATPEDAFKINHLDLCADIF